MKKLLIILVAGLTVLAIGAGIASALKSIDQWKPANTQFKADSKQTKFEVGSIKDECEHFEVKGTTPAGSQNKFPDQTKIGTKPPEFTNCTIANTTASGEWKFEPHSGTITGTPKEECERSSGGQYNPATEDDDCITITIPQRGAVVEAAGLCTITIAPNGPFSITDYYDDEIGRMIDIQAAIPIEKKGAFCPSATVATFQGVFTINPIITDDE